MQPAGERYPQLASGQVSGHAAADRQVLTLFAELCEHVPDAAERAQMLGVSAEIEAVWSRGADLPVLRARRKTLDRALRDVATRH